MQFEHKGDISAMLSEEGEQINLKQRIYPAAANGAVEKWLVEVWNYQGLSFPCTTRVSALIASDACG
jgi:hypothetical protein